MAQIKSFKSLYPGEIERVTLLGDGKPLNWQLTSEGMTVAMPDQKPCKNAYVIKVNRKRPF